MNPSARAYAIIKDFESFEAKPYMCPAHIWTIGWGHTLGVTKDTPPVTQEEAQILLEADVAESVRVIRQYVTVPLTQGQLDALTSFVFNLGPGKPGEKDGFVWLKNGNTSTLLRKLNSGDYGGAAEQLLNWTRSRGQVLMGLVKRRIMEKAVFES
jgi:lysozyme